MAEGFRQSGLSGALSDALIRAESTVFLNDMFTAQHSASLEATFIVLHRSKQNCLARWSAVLLHSTNQLFIKAPSKANLCPDSLIDLLDVAEQFGCTEAFACIPKASTDCDEVIEELLALDFSPVSPREGGLASEFELLHFGF